MNNNYLNNGILFPYKLSEFKSEVNFQKQSMHILLEVEEGAEEFFEEEFFDEWFQK